MGWFWEGLAQKMQRLPEEKEILQTQMIGKVVEEQWGRVVGVQQMCE